MIKTTLKKLFGSRSKAVTLCRLLFNNQHLESSIGPYPANHGIKHIEQVVENLVHLASFMSNKKNKEELFAAALIHDIGMQRTRGHGHKGADAERTRREHAGKSILVELAGGLVLQAGFDRDSHDNIIDAAWAHAGDDEYSAEDKLAEIREIKKRLGRGHLLEISLLLRVADLLDLGRHRLPPGTASLKWDEDQDYHIRKHQVIRCVISPAEKAIELSYDIKKKEAANPREASSVLAIYREVYEQAKDHIDLLNDTLAHENVRWELMPLDENLFGKIYPRSAGIKLTSLQFNKALAAHKTRSNPQTPFMVDLMGHSLRGLFLASENAESGPHAKEANQLYKEILSALQREEVRLRVLVLDPAHENQQMYEVYEGQCRSSEEKTRRILPLYGPGRSFDGNEEEKGDIYLTLQALREIFQGHRFRRSDVEVRVTRRIMYANVNRFADRMIISPYKQEGLYLQSLSFVVENHNAPLFKAYEKEFQDIWEDFNETRLAVSAKDPDKKNENPIAELIPLPETATDQSAIPSFNYEEFLLGHARRIERWFKNEVTPPFEVEFQPSVSCHFKCRHCIGAAMTSRLMSASARPPAEWDWKSVFKLNSDDLRVERIRISGLSGEPLCAETRDFTFDILNTARENGRETVLFTNGHALCEPRVRSRLVEAAPNWVYVSLDACDPATFAAMKGCRLETYHEICQAIQEFCIETGRQLKQTQTVVGYVVTQANAHRLRRALEKGDDLAHGAGFIRFKPDIRGSFGISWRDWRETKDRILHRQKSGTGPRVFLTDVPWHHCLPNFGNRCWSQFFYSTIGPDGSVFPCDHLSHSANAALGNLSEEGFESIWSRLWERENALIGKIHPECILCSPFSSRVNRFVENLSVLFSGNGYQDRWQPIQKWIDRWRKDRCRPAA